ncbi:putative short chain dehydrogenase [Colletotrichum sublineola]|uniref:Putative short chain dehydrogenase n=1 Tax=Colletotrichum sublineola TaxID=1173701 RepID=A0A066WYX0_COLSU|nr:putative short chain dehydrogenase [Colletotrichum sublineola]
MSKFTVDVLLRLLSVTILHPVVSVLVACGLVLSGLEPSPVELGTDLGSTRWVGPLSDKMRWTLYCVAFSWVLSMNRFLNRRALNPAPKSKPDFSREVVVITGGSTGIGAKLVRKLEVTGATVVVLDMAPLSYNAGPRTSHIQCDISSSDDVRAAAKAINDHHGPASILVANAGIVRGKALLNATDEDLRSIFNVNVLGLLWTVRAFLPAMIARNRGHVLVTASSTAFMTIAGMSDYSASKAAVGSLVEGLHTELKHKHGNPAVAVSAIYPATITTTMFQNLDIPDMFLAPILDPDEVAQKMFDILSRGQSENAYMPAFASAKVWFRVVPTWVRVALQDMGSHMADKMGGKN